MVLYFLITLLLIHGNLDYFQISSLVSIRQCLVMELDELGLTHNLPEMLADMAVEQELMSKKVEEAKQERDKWNKAFSEAKG